MTQIQQVVMGLRNEASVKIPKIMQDINALLHSGQANTTVYRDAVFALLVEQGILCALSQLEQYSTVAPQQLPEFIRGQIPYEIWAYAQSGQLVPAAIDTVLKKLAMVGLFGTQQQPSYGNMANPVMNTGYNTGLTVTTQMQTEPASYTNNVGGIPVSGKFANTELTPVNYTPAPVTMEQTPAPAQPQVKPVMKARNIVLAPGLEVAQGDLSMDVKGFIQPGADDPYDITVNESSKFLKEIIEATLFKSDNHQADIGTRNLTVINVKAKCSDIVAYPDDLPYKDRYVTALCNLHMSKYDTQVIDNYIRDIGDLSDYVKTKMLSVKSRDITLRNLAKVSDLYQTMKDTNTKGIRSKVDVNVYKEIYTIDKKAIVLYDIITFNSLAECISSPTEIIFLTKYSYSALFEALSKVKENFEDEMAISLYLITYTGYLEYVVMYIEERDEFRLCLINNTIRE